ncbi:MAG: hypothetical protein KZQ78_09230 [Candidatus Thiodiazotropha sp. (ex Ustalcina ferruginea)]|nr:hypothetical protein [Candidatus Thiodiazotropha sp. (ex Ustalcina ferruginea)]
MIFHQGAKKTIYFTDHGETSLEVAEEHVPSNQNCGAQFRRLLSRLGDIGKLNSPEQLRNEGNGIFAVKTRCGLRAYGWFCNDPTTNAPLFVVGHCAYKKKDKANPLDLERAIEERNNFHGITLWQQ